jgi:hypothetical protein
MLEFGGGMPAATPTPQKKYAFSGSDNGPLGCYRGYVNSSMGVYVTDGSFSWVWRHKEKTIGKFDELTGHRSPAAEMAAFDAASRRR